MSQRLWQRGEEFSQKLPGILTEFSVQVASISLENHIHQECIVACEYDLFQSYLTQVRN